MGVELQCSDLFGRLAERGTPDCSSDTPCMMTRFTPLNLRIRESEGGPPCYLLASGSSKALQCLWQLSDGGAVSEQHLGCGSLWYGTPHTW